MKQKKKGAIELSITTIIVIVMGITLLILGLGLINNIMKGAGKLSDKVFTIADINIDKMIVTSKFTLPSEVTVKAGDVATIQGVIGHDGAVVQGPATFKVQLQKEFPTGITESMVLAKVLGDEFNLNEGQQATFYINIGAAANAPLTTGLNAPAYVVIVTASGQPYDQKAFIIKVQKGKGLLGDLLG